MFRKRIISNHSYYDDSCLLVKHTLPDFEEQPLLSLLLWNPSIEEVKVIPHDLSVSIPSNVIDRYQYHGFGYDYVRDDYKVIRDVDFYPDINYYLDAKKNVTSEYLYLFYNPLWEIYSLKSNSWKKIDLDMPANNLNAEFVLERVYTNGVCHWLGQRKTDIDKNYLVSFDLGNEVFFMTSMPSYMDDSIDSKLEDTHLMLLNESIALISNDAEINTFHISILGEIGGKESWTKLFIIRPLICLGLPIGVGNNGDIFFVKEDEELVKYDLSTNTILRAWHYRRSLLFSDSNL